ncbi:MAG: histidine kinase [Lewinellaceae bacterium]|nr:histidine kinase [Lewinellaceae bacterium]
MGGPLCDERPGFATKSLPVQILESLPSPQKHRMGNWRDQITNNRYFYHYLFWAIVLFSYFVDAAELRHFDTHLFFRTLILKNGLLIAIVYLHLRVLIPAFLNPKRYGLYTFSLLLTIACGALLTSRIENNPWQQVHERMHPPLEEQKENAHTPVEIETEENVFPETLSYNRLVLNALTVCRYLVISILLKFIDDFFRQREQLQQVQLEKTMAELNVLKAQINPHFLFNTLNNLYGLVLERSDLAAETVLKLADIMKYTLAEGNASTVPLKKDLDNLHNYFDLELLRLPDAADVSFTIEGAVENQRIAPLLLLPLVENAFKHGVYRSREKPFLKLEIKVTGNMLQLKTLNLHPAHGESSPSLGLGLQNVQKRLDLLYPNRYRLETGADQGYFNVRLQLQLK